MSYEYNKIKHLFKNVSDITYETRNMYICDNYIKIMVNTGYIYFEKNNIYHQTALIINNIFENMEWCDCEYYRECLQKLK